MLKLAAKNFAATSRHRLAVLAVIVGLFALTGPTMAQDPFLYCDALIVQGDNAQLQERVTTVPRVFSRWEDVGAANPGEINNMGFDPTAGLLYAVELTPNGNNGIVALDRAGTVFPLGFPSGLPPDQRFDAGDVSPDDRTMYVNRAGFSPLYIVDLDTMTTTSVPITGATGLVHDWAYNPVDGLLYGGDTIGQLAILDPVSGVRVDQAVGGGGLPRGSAYGGAWFDAFGLLWLYNNSGFLYVVDPAVPTVVDIQRELDSIHNDGASCWTEFLPTDEFVDFQGWAPKVETCTQNSCTHLENFCTGVCGGYACGTYNAHEACSCTYYESGC